MPILNTLKDLNATIKNNVEEMVLDLPVASENRLRGQMLIAIFSNYGKYLLDKGTSLKDTLDITSALINEFKSKNGTFCNAEYTTKSLDTIKEYGIQKLQIKKHIAHDFLMNSSSYLKKYIQNANIVSDIQRAEESMTEVKPATNESLSLAIHYMDQCKEKLKHCNIDVDFVNAL